MPFSSYFTNPALNTYISGIYIGEDAERADMNDALRQLMADCALAWGVYDMGTLAAGTGNLGLVTTRSFSGNSSGDSRLYGENDQITATGAYGFETIRVRYAGVNHNITAGTTFHITNEHKFIWLRNAGNAQYATIDEVHSVIDGPGTVTTLFKGYSVASIVFGTVVVPEYRGFSCGQITDGTKVTVGSCFHAEHQQTTAVSGMAAGFRSQLRTVTGNFSFVADTNDGSPPAPACFAGKVKVGSESTYAAVAPLWDMHVLSNADDYALCVQNRSGGNPYIGRFEFRNLAPRNRTNKFATYVDTSGELAAIYSNGDIDSIGKIRATSAIGGIGYGTGAGNAQTQATNKNTSVTINAPCGQITTANSAIGANASALFTLNNSQIATNDIVLVALQSGAVAYRVDVDGITAGSVRIRIWNLTGGSLSDVLVINFALIKAVAS
jgi:hypothetical protein